MRRRLNVKLLLWSCGGVLAGASMFHLLHLAQASRAAEALLEQADRAVTLGRPESALAHYAHYLQVAPDDVGAQQRYAEALDRHAGPAERFRLLGLMEQVLYARPDEHALRRRLVHNLIAFERYADAAEHLHVLLERQGATAELHHMLGWCQDAQRQYKAAVTSLRAAVKLDPRRLTSQALLAEILSERLLLLDEAGAALDAMVRANADNYRAYLIRARFHRRERHDAAVTADLAMARKLAPREPAVALAAAEWKHSRGKAAEAAEIVDHGLKAAPDDPALLWALANLRARAGRRAEAIELLERGLARRPRADELAVLRADLLLDDGKLAEAEGHVEQLHRDGVAPALENYLRGRLAVERGRWAEATPLLEQAHAELGPRSPWAGRVNVLLGACYRRLGEPVRTLAAFRRATQAEPGWATARLGLGAVLLDAGRPDEAAAELDAVAGTGTPPPEYWTLLARARLARTLRQPVEQRQWSEVEDALARAPARDAIEVALLEAEMRAARADLAGARAVLEAARAKHPQAAAPWCALAELARRASHDGVAERLLADAEKVLGDRAEIRLARCRLWAARGLDEDRRKLRTLSEGLHKLRFDDRGTVRRALAEAWQQLGEPAEAARQWQALADERPDDVRSRAALLDLAIAQGRGEEARRLLAEVRRREGDDGPLWRTARAALRIHEARGDADQLAEARADLEALQRAKVDNPRVPLLLARIAEMQGRTDEALRHDRRAVELGASDPAIVGRLLRRLIGRRDTLRAEETVAAYQRQRPLPPDLARLAAEIARSNHNPRLALERARQAAALPSRDYRDYLWLAELHDAADEPAEAEKLRREAVRLAPHAPETWVALVGHLTRAGNAEAAEQVLAQARATIPADRRDLTLARCHEALRQSERAAEAYRVGLAARPRDVILLGAAADFYLRAGHDAEAEAALRRLLTPEMAAPPEYLFRARRKLAALRAGRALDSGDDTARVEALALLDVNLRARASIADERVRWFALGTRAADRSEALAKLRAGFAAAPPTADEQVLLARLYEASRQLYKARQELAQVVARHSHEPHYRARYVDVLIRSEALVEAETHLARLAELEPNSPRVRALQEALRKARAAL